ncbi:MAG: hypothetical protein V3V35_07280 [Dehalococcoidia bacterium]
MAADPMASIIEWAKALNEVAGQNGITLAALSDSAGPSDVVSWAESLATAAGGFVKIPPLAKGADSAAILEWAKSVDDGVRGFGFSLPSLPS